MKRLFKKVFEVRGQSAAATPLFPFFLPRHRTPLAAALQISVALLLVTLTSLSSFGADAAALKPVAPGSMGAAVFRMVGSLAFVVALFFAGAWLFRNMHRFRQPGAPQRKLQVLEAKSLGARQAVYVVAFEQQRLLIGSSTQGLTLLTHLPDGAPQSDAESIVPVSFGEALMQALGRK